MDIATFHARRRFAETASGRIAYIEDGEGPVALFVHGVPLNGYHWRHVIDRVRHRRRCIAVDLMALGYTEIAPTQDVSFTSQARMLAEVLDVLGMDGIDLVGNDSGGAIAQIFAAHHPERLRSLVLTNCDVHDGWPPPQVLPLIRSTAGRLSRACRHGHVRFHASAGAVATASLTRSTARCRRRRAAGRNGTGLLRRARRHWPSNSIPIVSSSNESRIGSLKRCRSLSRRIIVSAGSSAFDRNVSPSRPQSIPQGTSASSKRITMARSPIAPGKAMRYGLCASMKTAWLGVPMTCRPGASCFAKTPTKGSTTASKL